MSTQIDALVTEVNSLKAALADEQAATAGLRGSVDAAIKAMGDLRTQLAAAVTSIGVSAEDAAKLDALVADTHAAVVALQGDTAADTASKASLDASVTPTTPAPVPAPATDPTPPTA